MFLWRVKRHEESGDAYGAPILVVSTRSHSLIPRSRTAWVAGWSPRESPEHGWLSCRVGSVAEMSGDQASDDPAALAAAELAKAKERLLTEPPQYVVANHAMGLFEFGALHLTSTPPNLEAAVLAIDGMACLVEGLEGRLGPDEDTLQAALEQIRLAFVQVKASLG